MALCRLHRVLHGDLAGVVALILKSSQIFVNSSVEYSSPLSQSIFLGLPNLLIQFCRKVLIIILGYLLLIITALL